MYKNFLRIVISGRALNVIFRHLPNVIFGFIPIIHAKHYSLDTRVTPEYDGDLMVDSRVTPEYDNGKRMCFVSENDNLVAQCGRSMIEMLGVLAIIGVLSVGGIAGYSKAMMKFKINKTLQQISEIVTNVRTLYAQQKNYSGLTTQSAVQMGVIPDNLSSYGYARPNVSSFLHEWGGHGWVMDASCGDSTGQRKQFAVGYENLPKDICIALATADWGTSNSSGVLGVTIGSGTILSEEWGDVCTDFFEGCTFEGGYNGYGGKEYCSSKLPISPALASTLCNCLNGDCSIFITYK